MYLIGKKGVWTNRNILEQVFVFDKVRQTF